MSTASPASRVFALRLSLVYALAGAMLALPLHPTNAQTKVGRLAHASFAHQQAGCALDNAQIGTTVTVSPGWNLIGGPDASCITGADNIAYFIPLETTQSSMPEYREDLNGNGWGGRPEWSYFPNEGSLILSAPRPSFSNGLTYFYYHPGVWIMIPNQSPYGPATIISGVGLSLVYDPDSGWTETDTIPVGRSALVLVADSPDIGIVEGGQVEEFTTITVQTAVAQP